MTEWYVMANLVLTCLAGIICYMAGDRLKWVGVALFINFTLCTLSLTHGLSGWHYKALSSLLDVGFIVSVVYAMRAYPMARGLYLAGVVMMTSVFSHWAAHVSLLVTGNAHNLTYFVITNGAIAFAAFGLIWTGLSLIGVRHGLVDRVHGAVWNSECWRVPVGARKRSTTWKA